MTPIENYEGFCKAFRKDIEEATRAEMLLFLQNWIIRIVDKIDSESTDYSLDALLIESQGERYHRDAKKDVLSRLIDDSYDSVRRISENMRENIIRENVKVPIYKVREVNSYGMNWLSRRPGTTIKEKISSSNASMMAVQRRMSLDTGENRLFLAYLRGIVDLLQIKLEVFPERYQRREEETFFSLASAVIRDPDLSEIGRWENTPPNNTLLSDQSYKKIWRCWNEFEEIDDMVSNSYHNIAHSISTVFFVQLLTKLCQFFSFPQVPIEVNYEDFSVNKYCNIFYGIDASNKKLRIMTQDDSIHLDYAGRTVDVDFCDTVLQMSVNGERERELQLNPGTILRCVDLVLLKLNCKKLARVFERCTKTAKKCNSLVMDLFSVRPHYIGDEKKDVEILQGRLMRQVHAVKSVDGQQKFDIACDLSTAIILGTDNTISTYTVSSALERGSSGQMSKLMHLLEQYVTAQKFTFVFPDIYNEFQLSLVHRATRLAFHDVRSFPRSVGIAFSYMYTESFENSFKVGDFLMVVDLVDDDICVTLLQGLMDNTVENDVPEYRGLVWERHPSISYSVEKEISELKDDLLKAECPDKNQVFQLFGHNGFVSESEQLSAIFDDNYFFTFSATAKDLVCKSKINISDRIDDFLIKHKEIIQNRNVHIISIAEQLRYKGRHEYLHLSSDMALTGCNRYQRLQKRSRVTLWRDHLPALAIKLLHGKFNFVDDETITPEFNTQKKIRIDNVFTLTKNMPEYHFDLVQSDVNRNTRYAAVVKNPAFPLKCDVQCRLDMTYQYGTEEPYRLIFIPIEKNVGFVEAKVLWEKITVYPYMKIPCPSPLPFITWDELRHYEGRYGEEDLIFGKRNLMDIFCEIQTEYRCFGLQERNLQIHGEPGYRVFTENFENENGNTTVVFSERNLEYCNRKVDFLGRGVVSYELEPVAPSYHLNLQEQVRPGDNIWTENERGHYCIRSMQIDEKTWKILFYASNFLNPSDFKSGVSQIAFDVKDKDERTKIAIRIIAEENSERCYVAKHLRAGNRPWKHTYDSRFQFLLYTVLTGRNSLCDAESPESLRKIFQNTVGPWIKSYKQCDDNSVKRQIFRQMSLLAKDIGTPYYELAEEYIRSYRYNELDCLGYGMGALESEEETKLFKQVLSLPQNVIVSILSKAVWWNEHFIENIDPLTMLSYFDFAIDDLYNQIKHIKDDLGRIVTTCLEFLLGVFRLREFKDEKLNKAISLNNRKVQKLYSCIEEIIKLTQDGKLEVRSFLKLEITDRDELYKDIPDILYAMLVYITGEKNAGNIKISGLATDDVNT